LKKVVVRLLPLVVLYLVVVSVYMGRHADLRVDETRYTVFAENLTEGYYSPASRVNLWNGPGYPLVLAPLAAVGAPWAAARFLNIVFMFLAFLYLYRTLRMYVSSTLAYVAVYCIGLLPIVIEYLPRLMTEPLSILLMSGLAYHFSKIHRSGPGTRLHLLAASGYLGYLALTKVLFGYVIAAGIIVFLAAFLIRRRRAAAESLLVVLLAMAVCVPYLLYTHSLTGKAFYWGNSGGMSIYWMSNPYENEYGDWLAGVKPWLAREKGKNHIEFLDGLRQYDAVERDQVLRRTALKNIREHPGKFVKNWGCNLGRLFCNYPFSYTPEEPRTYLTLIPGVLIAALLALTVYPAYVGRRHIPYEIYALSVIGLLYIGGNSLLSAYNRMLMPALPVLALWISFVLGNLVEPGSFKTGVMST
jgi:hypothetical protein